MNVAGIVLQCLLATCLVAAAYGQSEQPAPAAGTKDSSFSDKRVVLKVGNAQITEKDFETRIADIEPEGGGDPDSAGGKLEKDRRDLGNDYASVLMLSQKAIADHIDTSPEIRRQLEVARLQILSDAEFAKLMRQSEPTSQEVQDYYSSHASDYEQVRVRRLFIWKHHDDPKSGPNLTSEEARAHADKIRAELAAGSSPEKLAEELKQTDGGLFDVAPIYFPRGELPARMEKAAFSLKEGEWSEVEDTPDSLILVQLVKRSQRPLSEVSSAVKDRLHNEKMQATLDDLKKKTGIWMDPKYFAISKDSDSLPTPNVRKSAVTQENKNEQ